MLSHRWLSPFGKQCVESSVVVVKAHFVEYVIKEDAGYPCGSLKRGLKESSISRMKRWRS